ncbi:MAG: helix-turn-helix transcriptional regulator, partial [Gemmatimonadota bacterium]
GLGDSQRRLLVELKRRGDATLYDVAGELELAAETVREHLNALTARGLVERTGRRRDGPGRPQIVYALSERGEALFPHREGALLRELASHLVESGREEVLEEFFGRRIGEQRRAAAERLDGLEGGERLREVAALLSEQGFMAEVVGDAADGPRLRLCHCPLKELVAASRLPCRAEIEFVEELLGADLERESWMPEGDHACTYRLADEAPAGNA